MPACSSVARGCTRRAAAPASTSGPTARSPSPTDPSPSPRSCIAGFTLIDVSSRDEALEWVRKWPRIGGEQGFALELRQVFAAEDFGAELTPELQEREAQMRAQTGATPATSSQP